MFYLCFIKMLQPVSVYNLRKIQSSLDILNTDISKALTSKSIVCTHFESNLHFISFLLKLLIFQSYFSGTRIYTLRYLYLGMKFLFVTSRVDPLY